ncbi:hypothetical protein Q8F55_005364 [Vanrija albida]|uniref:Protein transport protein SFT2 n=1 Tax=Vanrija albida TaxID=181172 RepID=A0ABR3Q1F6_9TREE
MPKGWFNLDNQSEESIFNNEKPQFDLGLTRMQRLYAFIGCFAAGFLLSILGAVFLIIGLAGAFAMLFGIGAIVSLLGTGFLIGFGRQLKLMFKPVRIAATIIMFLALAMVFVSAFLLKPAFLCIIFVIIEYCAMTWYSLSYIPYARSAVKNLVSIALSDRQYFSGEPSSYRPARLSRRDRLHGFWWIWGGSAALSFIGTVLCLLAYTQNEGFEGTNRQVGMAMWLTCPIVLGIPCFIVESGFTCAFRRQFRLLARPKHLVPFLATVASWAMCIFLIAYGDDWAYGLNRRDYLRALYPVFWAAFYAAQLWYNASFASPLGSFFGRRDKTVESIAA